MKNFKKILMLTALISSVAIAEPGPVTPGTITNPGDDITTAVSEGDSAQAGVPMEVRVNVIGQGPQLVLVDETGTLIENLTFDHGNKLLAGGQINGDNQTTQTYIPQESTVERIVVLKRTDGKAFGADNKGVETSASSKNYTGNFIAMSHNPLDDGKKHQMTLTRLGNSDLEAPEGGGITTAHTMTTGLEYESQDMTVKGTAKEIRTTVVSRIKAKTLAKPGLYIGTGTFVGKLTLKGEE